MYISVARASKVLSLCGDLKAKIDAAAALPSMPSEMRADLTADDAVRLAAPLEELVDEALVLQELLDDQGIQDYMWSD